MNNLINPRIASERTIINRRGVITIVPKGGVIPFQSSNSNHWSSQPQVQ